MRKKLLAILLTVAMVVAYMPAMTLTSFADEAEEVQSNAEPTVEQKTEPTAEPVAETIAEEEVVVEENATTPEEVNGTETENSGATLEEVVVAEEKEVAASNAVAPQGIENLVYKGKSQPLVTFTNDKEAGKGCVQYEVSLNYYGGYTTNPDALTGKDAGTYTMYIQKRTAQDGVYYWGGERHQYWYWSDFSWRPAGKLEVTIAKAPVEFNGLKAKQKVYDGNNSATILNIDWTDQQYVGGVGEEKLLIVTKGNINTKGTFVDENADVDKVVTGNVKDFYLVKSMKYDGNPNNYALTEVAGKGTIIPRPVGIKGIKGVNKVYDGTTEAELDVANTDFYELGHHRGESGIVKGDVLSVEAKGTFEDKNVGNKKNVTISDINLTGTDARNYRISRNPWAVQKITEADITKRVVTFSVPNNSKYKGDEDPALSVNIGNVLSSDQAAFASRFTAEREAGEVVGTYAIHVKDAQDGAIVAQGEDVFNNYDFTAYASATGTFTIMKAVAPEKDDGADTGDSSNPLLVGLVALVALAGIGVALFRRREN